MARPVSLPKRLSYLRSFRKRFASRPDELNEETAEGPLFDLLCKRLKGLSELDAQKVLEEDLVALETWLSLPKHENDCLQFIRGFLLVSPSELAKRILEESAQKVPPPPSIEIDLPTEAKVKRIGNRSEAALIVKWKGLMIGYQAMAQPLAESLAQSEWEERPGSTVVSSPVRFGHVHGKKFVRMSDLIHLLGTKYKEVGYLLHAPGGFVSISVIPLSKKINQEKWDESIFECFFQTLRVVQRNSANCR